MDPSDGGEGVGAQQVDWVMRLRGRGKKVEADFFLAVE
jgi:hypothetical protein